jgi:hypothetical protein
LDHEDAEDCWIDLRTADNSEIFRFNKKTGASTLTIQSSDSSLLAAIELQPDVEVYNASTPDPTESIDNYRSGVPSEALSEAVHQLIDHPFNEGGPLSAVSCHSIVPDAITEGPSHAAGVINSSADHVGTASIEMKLQVAQQQGEHTIADAEFHLIEANRHELADSSSKSPSSLNLELPVPFENVSHLSSPPHLVLAVVKDEPQLELSESPVQVDANDLDRATSTHQDITHTADLLTLPVGRNALTNASLTSITSATSELSPALAANVESIVAKAITTARLSLHEEALNQLVAPTDAAVTESVDAIVTSAEPNEVNTTAVSVEDNQVEALVSHQDQVLVAHQDGVPTIDDAPSHLVVDTALSNASLTSITSAMSELSPILAANVESIVSKAITTARLSLHEEALNQLAAPTDAAITESVDANVTSAEPNEVNTTAVSVKESEPYTLELRQEVEPVAHQDEENEVPTIDDAPSHLVVNTALSNGSLTSITSATSELSPTLAANVETIVAKAITTARLSLHEEALNQLAAPANESADLNVALNSETIVRDEYEQGHPSAAAVDEAENQSGQIAIEGGVSQAQPLPARDAIEEVASVSRSSLESEGPFEETVGEREETYRAIVDEVR